MTIFKLTPGLTEQLWPSVIQSPISVAKHIITVNSTIGLKVKMIITLSKAGIGVEQFEIKRVFDNKSFMVGPVGKNISKISEAVKFDGGQLYANEQSRNKLGDAPIMRAVYEEEPTIAIRTINVGPTGKLEGTPESDLEKVPPDACFLYGCAYETTSIREFVPSEKLHRGVIDINIGASTVEVTQIEAWMVPGESFLAMSVDGMGEVACLEEFEITAILGTVMSVTPAPTIAYSGDGLLDGSLGDKVRVTNFEYGHAYEVEKIYTTFDTVGVDDIIKKLR